MIQWQYRALIGQDPGLRHRLGLEQVLQRDGGREDRGPDPAGVQGLDRAAVRGEGERFKIITISKNNND